MRNPSDLPRRPQRRVRSRRANRGRALIITIVAVLLVGLLSARSLSTLYVDKLWYDSIDRSNVFWTMLGTKVGLAAFFTLIFVVIALISLLIADRLAPIDPGEGPEAEFVERYRDIVGGWQPWVRLAVCVLFGLMLGGPASSQWQEWLMFRNGRSFGWADPTFDRDAGFYVFRLPFMTYVIDWFFVAFLMVLIITLVAHFFNGGVRMALGSRRATSQVKLHVSVILAVMAMLKGADYWLAQFELTRSSRGYTDGMSFTEKNAQLPALKLLILVSLLAAVLLVVNVRQRGFRLPVISVGLWLVTAIVAGTLYPAGVQFFQVRPNPSSREREFIAYNIAATRYAIGLERVQQQELVLGDVTAADVNASRKRFEDARLLDPSIVRDSFQNELAIEGYYTFDDNLSDTDDHVDLDRYDLDGDGRQEQYVVSVRSLKPADVPNKSWESRHVNYTHGYGVVLAPASSTTVDSPPAYIDVRGPDNGLAVERPQIYFSDVTPEYAVVGTVGAVGETSLDPARPPYAGDDGVSLDGRLRRLAFFIATGEYNLFGSRVIDGDSRILMHRNVRDRVAKVAPFLAFDSDPYAVVADGRIVWVVDGYTTSNRFPNAESADNRRLPRQSELDGPFNYVRNSVKATVDAYDGTVTLYAYDSSDPLLAAWNASIPGLLRDQSTMPASIAAHLRYPQDLFQVQTNMYGRYRITDPGRFYSTNGAWSVAQRSPDRQEKVSATQPSGIAPATTIVGTRDGRTQDSSENKFEPYYTLFTPPGSETAEFALLRAYVAFSITGDRTQLQAFMTATTDGDGPPRLVAYELKGAQLPPGPLLVASQQSQVFGRDLTQLDSEGSSVRFADTQIVPTSAGIVYIRPWFIESDSAKKIPRLERVTATINGRTARGATVGEALQALFPQDQISVGGEPGTPVDPEPPDPDDSSPEAIKLLLDQADALFAEAQQALADGDLGLYQRKIESAYDTAARAAKAAAEQARDDQGEA